MGFFPLAKCQWTLERRVVSCINAWVHPCTMNLELQEYELRHPVHFYEENGRKKEAPVVTYGHEQIKTKAGCHNLG